MRSPLPAVADVVSEIRAAFDDVTRGDGVTLEEADLHDRCCTDASRFTEARNRAIDEHWWQVPSDDLRQWGDAIPFLDEAGYLYYLPALMTWALSLPKQEFYCEPAPQSLLLSLGSSSTSGKRFKPCTFANSMTAAQISAVTAFLSASAVLLECADCRELLERFWLRHKVAGT